MAAGGGRNAPVCGGEHGYRAPQHDGMRRDGGGEPYWSRPECRVWTAVLLLGTCLLYCARVTVPICAVALSAHFGWDKKQSGVVLSSFFWGYCLTQVIGGHISDQIGGEKVLLLSASAWGFLTFITPLLTQITSAHLVFMTCSRFLMGLLQGVYFPSLASLLSQRVRESERAFTYSTVGTGSQFGTLVIGAAGSLLLDWYGWESVFYFSGLLTLLWVYCTCKYLLTEKDLVIPIDYLMRSISISKQNKVPWKQLFKKAPIWAVIVAQLCTASTFFTLLSWLPTFFKETFPESKVSTGGGRRAGLPALLSESGVVFCAGLATPCCWAGGGALPLGVAVPVAVVAAPPPPSAAPVRSGQIPASF
uniref:Major facilitator superfamily (MFS) profile domain-containing protein n=1 Tax=Meleagris gallopavo TaxID=9103 RepID=G1N340_MELGA